MKLWLDDVFPPPAGDMVWVKTVGGALREIASGPVEELHIDNDLGPGEPEGRELLLLIYHTSVVPNLLSRNLQNCTYRSISNNVIGDGAIKRLIDDIMDARDAYQT